MPKIRDSGVRALTVDNKTPTSAASDGDLLPLLSWNEIEPWQQHNPFITTAYRPSTNSYVRSVKSVRQIHNQTVNIWSHLLGAIAVIVSAIVLHRIYSSRLHQATTTDLLLFGQFFLGAITCLLCSTAFHTFNNHSESIYHSFLLNDLAGVIFLTTTSFYPGLYYGFNCEPELIFIYSAMITVFGTGALVACLVPEFRHKSRDGIRATMLIAMGLSGILPMTHAAFKFGIAQVSQQMGWDWYVYEGICYVSGAVFYMAKFPERLRPGKFDVWGSSHQIFHVFVLFGIACHLRGVLRAFDYHHKHVTARC